MSLSAFQTLSEHSEDLILRLDLTLQCHYANPAALRWGGIAPGADALAGLARAVAPLVAVEAIAAAVASGVPVPYGVRDGGRAYEVQVLPEQDAAGPAVLWVAREVSVLYAFQRQLQEREAMLRAVLDTMPDAVMMGNANGEIDSVNRAAERIFGYPEAELRGQNARVLFDGPLGQRDDLLARFGTAVLRYGQRGAYEAVGRRKDGSLVPCELLLAANEVGGRRHYTGLIRDVSDRKAADKALRESGDRYRALSKLIGAFALEYQIEAGDEVHLEWVTDTVTSVLGYPVADALSLRIADLVHPEDEPAWARLLRQVKGGKEWTADVRIRSRKGAYVWMRVFAYPVRDEGGRVVRIHAAAQDVTAQRAVQAALVDAKERAEEAARLKDALLANMSHEIRTPLTAILGFAEVVRDEAPPHVLEYVDLIASGGRRLMETLTSVLDLAQLQARTLALVPTRVDVQELLEETVSMFSTMARAKNLVLTLVPGPSLVVEVDRGALLRIVTNLVGNALKFTEAGHIALSVARVGPHIELRVRDTGEGIDRDFLPHLFEAFQQESSGLSRRHEGSGLGLAITKNLVALMGGTIQVSSEKGVGTEFVVVLPAPFVIPSVAPSSLAGADLSPVIVHLPHERGGPPLAGRARSFDT